MCKFLIFNTQKRYEKQKNLGSFSATFWQLLDTFIANFFGISLGFFFFIGNLWLSLVIITLDMIVFAMYNDRCFSPGEIVREVS